MIADIGDSLFGAADLSMSRRTEFISPAYYTSMGFAVPAAVGAGMANPDAAGPGDRRRRRVPDDGHGAFDDRPVRPQSDRRRPEQPRLHDRAVPARRARSTTSMTGRSTRSPRCSAAASAWRSGPRRNSTRHFRPRWRTPASFSLLNVHLDPWDHSPALVDWHRGWRISCDERRGNTPGPMTT